MLRKEFRDITRSCLLKLFYYFLIVTCIQLFFRGINYFDLIIGTFGILIYWISIDYGSKMYKFEINDHSWEYLLSLPISRHRIIFIKLFPRLIIIGILSVVYIVALTIFFDDVTIHDYDILHPFFLVPFAFAAIFYGAIFKIDKSKNRILLALLEYAAIGTVAWFLYLYFNSAYTKVFDKYPFWGGLLTGFIVVAAVEFIVFLKYFKSFDMKQNNIDGRMFALMAMPYLLTLIFAVLSMIFFRVNTIL